MLSKSLGCLGGDENKVYAHFIFLHSPPLTKKNSCNNIRHLSKLCYKFNNDIVEKKVIDASKNQKMVK